MNETVKQHLPVIAVVTLLGIATTYFLLARVYSNAVSLSADSFSTYIFGIPCIGMFICSTVIMMTAHRIGRQLYLVIVAICLVAGVISMLVTSTWLSDESITSLLLANSPAGTVITPVLKSPIVILRDIAAFFVAPTVGCIFGAWLGSRIHPMTSDTMPKNKKKSKKKS